MISKNTKKQMKKIGGIALVVMLLVSSIGPIMFTGTASAQEDTTDTTTTPQCEIVESMVGIQVCQSAVEKYEEQTADQLHYSIYADSSLMWDYRTQNTVEKSAKVNQVSFLGMSEAKFWIIQELNNGSSKAEAIDKAAKEIDAAFAEEQKSLFIHQNRQMQDLRIMDQEIEQTDLTWDEVTPYPTDSLDRVSSEDNIVTFGEHNVTLWDNEDINVTTAQLIYQVDEDPNDDSVEHHRVELANYTYGLETPDAVDISGSMTLTEVSEHDNLNILAPYSSDNNETIIATEGSDYADTISTLNERRQDAKGQIGTFADKMFSQYDPGEIAWTRVSGPVEQAQTASSNYDRTGHYSYLLKTAAQMGFSIPDAASMTVEADFDPRDTDMEVKDGVLYAHQDAFQNGTIEVGKTYDTATLSTDVGFISANQARAKEYTITGEFTVQEAWNPQNESETYQTVQMEDMGFETTDTDNINDQIDSLIEQMERIEDQYGDDSVAGGTGAITGFFEDIFSIPGDMWAGFTGFLTSVGKWILIILALGFGTFILLGGGGGGGTILVDDTA